MRCLQCGSQLALLKKFTDGEFCSAEHRTLFYDSQQKLIIERLAASALRFKRHKEHSKPARQPAHVEPVPVAPKEVLPPFAQILPEIVLDTLYIRNPQFAMAPPIPAIGAELVLILPTIRSFVKRARFGLASPVYGYVFAREWRRPRISLRILDSASQLRPIPPLMPEFRLSTGIRSSAQPDPFFEKTNPSSSSQLLDSTTTRTSTVVPFEAKVTPVPPGFAKDSSEILGLDSLRNAFRMRPRGPVQDAAVAVFHEIKANPVEPPPTEVHAVPVFPVAQLPAEGPLAATRFFRPRPRGPVSSAPLLETERIEASCEPMGSQSAVLPCMANAAAPALSPAVLNRLESVDNGASEAVLSSPMPAALPQRPRGPVQASSLEGSDEISAGSAFSLPAKPANATLPAYLIGECSPSPVVRFFTARPRGPVQASSLEGSDEISAGSALSLPAKLANATLPAYLIGECSPSPVVRFFKARPRGPVQAHAVAAFEQIAAGSASELLSRPVIGTLPASAIGECSPGALVRFFKARPRVPVSSDAFAMEAISGDSQPLLSKPVVAALSVDLIGDCSPDPLLRFFKARPRGPIQASTLAAFEQIPAGASLNLLRRATGTLPSHVIGECSPNPVACFFNARLRGVITADASGMEAILGDSPSLLSQPVIAALSPDVIGECSPSPVVRFFKARPRGPVQSRVKPLMGDAGANLAGQTEIGPRMPALPQIVPGAVAPAALHQPFRVMPLAGVADQGLGSGDPIDSGSSLPIRMTPLLGALPASIIGDLAPPLREKPYRMKPRGPVQASDLAAFQPVHSGNAADLSRKGMAPRLLLSAGIDFAPTFLNRFYKMRPRGPIPAHATLFEALQAVRPETLQSKASIPGMPAVLMRQPRMSSRDRSSRPGPPGPRPSAGSTTLKHIDEEDTETRVPQASMSALPGSVLADCAPRGLNRCFRMRPPGAFSGRKTPGFEQIPTGSAFAAVGALEMTEPQLNPALAGQPPADPLSADSIFALTSAECYAPLQPFAPQPQFNSVALHARVSMPGFASDLIVDYRPSLIEIREALRESHKPGFFASVAEFWNEATWDLKWAAAAVPVLLGLFIHSAITRPALPVMQNVETAAIASNPLPPLQRVVTNNLGELRHQMIGRSGVDLRDDFTAGLSAWNGEKGWNSTWTQDAHGGVKPGALALFTPSTRLRDYIVEFTGEIEKNSFGWVYRAADTQNYYAVKLVTLSSGPMPTVAVLRYAVIGGKQGPTTRKILPYPVTSDTIYRVAMTVEGQFFTLLVQGHVVDFWSDDRLKTGGIGFFSGKGEESRLESVRVVHQLDALGRLYASLSLQTASQSGVGIHEPKK